MKNFYNQTKAILFAIAFTIASSAAFAQTLGDYQTKASGNWENTSTWEFYNGTNWVNATVVPAVDAGNVIATVKHNVTVTGTSSMPTSVVVTSTNTLTVGSTGAFNMGDGIITGTGNFTLDTAGEILIGHPDGIDDLAASGNIQVAGTVTLPSNAIYTYNGTENQNSGDGIPSTVRELGIVGGDSLFMDKTVAITGTLNMESGFIYTTTNSFLFWYDNTNLQTANSNVSEDSMAFIIGPIQIQFNSTTLKGFDIPFGIPSSYHPISIEMRHSKATDNIYWFGVASPSQNNQNLDTPKIEAIHPDFSYYQEKYSVTSSLLQQSIEIYWFDDDGVSVLSSTTVAQYKNNVWTPITGSYTITGDTTFGSIIFSNNSQDRRDVALATTDLSDNKLPVSLIDYTAEVVNGGVAINWTTAQEINNSHFIVERSFDNGTYEFVALVEGAGNSSEAIEYATMDFNAPAEGTVFYKLTQYDFDGTSEVVGIEAVTLSGMKNLIFSPNPANGVVRVTVPEGMVEDVTVSISDMAGRVLISKTLNSADIANGAVSFSVDALRAGTYFINASDNKTQVTSRIIKN